MVLKMGLKWVKYDEFILSLDLVREIRKKLYENRFDNAKLIMRLDKELSNRNGLLPEDFIIHGLAWSPHKYDESVEDD